MKGGGHSKAAAQRSSLYCSFNHQKDDTDNIDVFMGQFAELLGAAIEGLKIKNYFFALLLSEKQEL